MPVSLIMNISIRLPPSPIDCVLYSQHAESVNRQLGSNMFELVKCVSFSVCFCHARTTFQDKFYFLFDPILRTFIVIIFVEKLIS